jgi:carbon-monoxide dehydrogenase large subunit
MTSRARLAGGAGRFLADLPRPAGALELAFVRSPFAHAGIGEISGAGATAEDLGLRDLTVTGPGLRPRPWPALARDRVRFAGQPVAVVWAEDRYRAEDLAEQVAVDYEPLDLEPPELLFEHELGAGPLEATMREAARVVEREFTTARQTPLPLEGRGVVAEWSAGRLTVWTSTQVPDIVRRGVAIALGLREAAIRVVVPDVGGGFGLKAHVFPEEIVAAALAGRLERPVRWVEDRQENLLAGVHAHDNRVRLLAAVAADGRVLAVDAEVVSDVGAYPVYPFSASLEPVTAASALFAPYDLKALRVRAAAVSSHRCPVGAYRGVGTNTAVYATERMLDEIAAELRLDPLELRRRNALGGLPRTTLGGRALDSGDYAALLDRLAAAGYDELRAEQANARAAGRLFGIGVALFNEHSGTGATEYRGRGLSEVPGLDACRVRVTAGGGVEIAASSVEIGQGLAETCRLVAARELGIEPSRIEVVMGDTDRCPPGTGAFVSRGAVGLMDALVAALRDVAVSPSGASRGVPGDLEPGTDVTRTVDPRQVFPSGAHLAAVEVDAGTYRPRLLRYVAVEDCGTPLDVAAVEGQVRGGVAMGAGKVLLEEFRYGPDGQPRSASLLDYLVTTAADVPPIEVEHVVTPSPRTALGSKGVGEAGTVGAFGAIANAVADAVAPLGARLTALPFSPQRIEAAIPRTGENEAPPRG